MKLNEVKTYYSTIVSTEKEKISKLKKEIFQVGTLRLVIFMATIAALYVFWNNTQAVIGSIVGGLIVFLALMKFHNKLFRKKRYCEQQRTNAENELKGLDYDFSAFDGAPEKIDADHSFSLDLDLFGKRSLFQSINRTVTSFGKDCLADMLLKPLDNKNKIQERQQSIAELKAQAKLLAHFRAIGEMNEIDKLNAKDFSSSFSRPPLLSKSLFWNALVWIIPALYLFLAILVYFDIVTSYWLITLYVTTIIISNIPIKKTKLIANTFEQKSKSLETYSELFEIAENGKFETAVLKDIQNQLSKNEKASKAILNLKSLYNSLDVAFSFPVLMFFNPVLLWNVKYAIRIEKWIEQHKENVNHWFEAIAGFDALVSMAVFAFNHPDYVYPVATDKFTFEGKDLGHPLIHRDVCVRNDIDINKTPYFLVITGANMAGKSTYLRTIGINHTLACAGAPVCGESLFFYPGKLVTNLRTADSLADNESYFFAELKRLKMIIDRLQSGEELFIILDEILKGTNSEDKQKGSLALIKQFIALDGNGIIATHDLVLGNLQNEYPNNVKNFCFEADITNNHLSFTYQIREGIAQNMNACFLMKKMGITGLE